MSNFGSKNTTQRVNKPRELKGGSKNPTQRINKLRELTVPVPEGPNDSENHSTKCTRSSCLNKALLHSSYDHKTPQRGTCLLDQNGN